MRQSLKKLSLPYVFNGMNTMSIAEVPQHGKVVENMLMKAHLGKGIKREFKSIYSDVLSAIAENDREYLQGVMEKRLYERTIIGLDQIEKLGYKINFATNETSDIVEEETEEQEEAKDQDPESEPIQQDLVLHAYGILGAKINRVENQNSSPFELKVLNNTYYTPQKLYITDKNDEIIYGSSDLTTSESHSWRFESYSENLDWVLTDMDSVLNGNPFFEKLSVVNH